MKTWQITGIHDGEAFVAELTVDTDGDVTAAEWPIAELLGLRWTDARQSLIDRGFHGKPQSVPMVEGNSELRRRGWTDSQIRKLLDEPDELKPNPHHEHGQPMRCYLLSRVEMIEREYSIGILKPQTAYAVV